jgi:L,D-transpeptidase YbiS
VIDTANNRLFVRERDRLMLEAVCSTGSGIRLREGASGRAWEFETPRGSFRVRHKIRAPLWVKPDWAFVEEGKPIPDRRSDRFEAGVLGDYALDLGDGYLIHGTLYERLLGRSVTHGCVRLGDQDLERVFEVARVGTPVFVF